MKIIPDTSIIIDGKISELAEKGEIDGEIIIPEFVIDEIENQANEGLEIGFAGIEEIKKIRELAEDLDIEISFTGRRPTDEEIKMASSGRIDALIRDVAEEQNATLYTGDIVQAKIADAKGIDHRLFEKERIESFSLKEYFDDTTMSVHLKQGSVPKAKKGMPGEFKLQKIEDDKLSKEEINELIQETIEKAEISDNGLIEMQKEGATVLQIGRYRIAISRPPFSELPEITAVRPVSKVSLDDYGLSEDLIERLDQKAEGILIAGAPGHGKSTFAQALAEHYEEKDKVLKTMEKPRDLDVGPDITQYTELEGDMENTGDFLLLVRPDYTVYDEVRKTHDFEVYSDLRMAGVGMVGVVHASEAVDAVQRLIGRVELGMIPQVVDTVIHIENAEVEEVYKLELTVKVPEGMMEQDLARPVVQIMELESSKPVYEIYTYGEETVVIPVDKDNTSDSSARKLARKQLRHELSGRVNQPEIEFISDDHIRLLVDEDEISHVIGSGGENIDRLENELGLDITVEPKGKTLKNGIDFQIEERGNSLIIDVGTDSSGDDIDVYDADEFLFTATVGKNGEISLTKDSDLAGRVLGSFESGHLDVKK